jgi:hypothetical protein
MDPLDMEEISLALIRVVLIVEEEDFLVEDQEIMEEQQGMAQVLFIQ